MPRAHPFDLQVLPKMPPAIIVQERELKRQRLSEDAGEDSHSLGPPVKRIVTSFSKAKYFHSSSPISPSTTSDSSAGSPEQESSKANQVEDVPVEDEIPPEGVTTWENIPPDHYSYFAQRYRLFSRFDEGVWLTENAWFEVTPENIARKISDHIFAASKRSHIQVILDAFCGVGGNTIQFALSPLCHKVIAIDSDPLAITCAKHNARIYGVEKKIEFVLGDFFGLVESWKEGDDSILEGVQAVFLSPPWGGPMYRSFKVFDVETMTYPFSTILKASSPISNNLAIFLPRTSDLNQLARWAPDKEKIQAIHYCIDLRSKGLCAYFGGLADIGDPDISC